MSRVRAIEVRAGDERPPVRRRAGGRSPGGHRGITSFAGRARAGDPPYDHRSAPGAAGVGSGDPSPSLLFKGSPEEKYSVVVVSAVDGVDRAPSSQAASRVGHVDRTGTAGGTTAAACGPMAADSCCPRGTPSCPQSCPQIVHGCPSLRGRCHGRSRRAPWGSLRWSPGRSERRSLRGRPGRCRAGSGWDVSRARLGPGRAGRYSDGPSERGCSDVGWDGGSAGRRITDGRVRGCVRSAPGRGRRSAVVRRARCGSSSSRASRWCGRGRRTSRRSSAVSGR